MTGRMLAVEAERCGQWMPRAQEPCYRRPGHDGQHSTAGAYLYRSGTRRSPKPTCPVCTGPMHRDNRYGVCSATVECRRESDRRARAERHPERLAYETGWRKRSQFSIVLRNSKQRATRLGIPFNLTHENLPSVPERCPVCGVEMVRGGKWHNQPSLDRLVPVAGYVDTNVVWICRQCNRLKDNATLDQLRQIVTYLEGALAA